MEKEKIKCFVVGTHVGLKKLSWEIQFSSNVQIINITKLYDLRGHRDISQVIWHVSCDALPDIWEIREYIKFELNR